MKEYIIPEEDTERLREVLYKIYVDWMLHNGFLRRELKPGMTYIILPNGIKIDLCGVLMAKVSGKIFNDIEVTE
jgi:hypothetical protein